MIEVHALKQLRFNITELFHRRLLKPLDSIFIATFMNHNERWYLHTGYQYNSYGTIPSGFLCMSLQLSETLIIADQLRLSQNM